ncbi:hypothetical protein Glove_174g153 [Diversispora epigaea]|uniref:Uncharacterized protein n=1 Tax=Diversispora epigaea TaxID=1348612 RepID=A0A397IP16_9GLOM|nr:hypothetical protein Glove_174g153 [Diversispora epigaea]
MFDNTKNYFYCNPIYLPSVRILRKNNVNIVETQYHQELQEAIATCEINCSKTIYLPSVRILRKNNVNIVETQYHQELQEAIATCEINCSKKSSKNNNIDLYCCLYLGVHDEIFNGFSFHARFSTDNAIRVPRHCP